MHRWTTHSRKIGKLAVDDFRELRVVEGRALRVRALVREEASRARSTRRLGGSRIAGAGGGGGGASVAAPPSRGGGATPLPLSPFSPPLPEPPAPLSLFSPPLPEPPAPLSV